MKILGTVAAVAAISACATASYGIVKKDQREITKDISGFSEIVSKGSMDVHITAGSDYAVRIVADADIAHKVTAELEGDSLHLGLERGNYYNIKKLDVYVSLPTLNALTLMGSGDIELDGLKNDSFKMFLKGSGDIVVKDANVDTIDVRLQGSGDIDMTGSCNSMTAYLQGSGDIDANDFVCKKMDATVRGSGDVAVHATDSANLELRGSGDIVLYGRPSKINEKTRGSGDITIR